MRYAKPWLSLDEQVDRLRERGVDIGDRARPLALLRDVGYYRLTGYLYPFRQTEVITESSERPRVRVLAEYRSGTRIEDAARLLEFDRTLRLLVLDAVERIEVAVRMQVGYRLGRHSAFAHEDPAFYTSVFTERRSGKDGAAGSSRHQEWLARVDERRRESDEAFVAHFRDRYEDRMPIWAVTELLELGHLSRLYAGLRNDIATEIAQAFGVPTKRLMQSWIATITYVRNIAAHHARLFNRKLVTAPKRPTASAVPLLAHLGTPEAPKQFGTYNALAVIAYLLRSVHPEGEWAERVREHLRNFPSTEHIDVGSIGVGAGWLDQEIWAGRPS